MILVCAIMLNCGLGITSQVNLECRKLGENSLKFLVDCSTSAAEYCGNGNHSAEYAKVLVDQNECVELKKDSETIPCK